MKLSQIHLGTKILQAKRVVKIGILTIIEIKIVGKTIKIVKIRATTLMMNGGITITLLTKIMIEINLEGDLLTIGTDIFKMSKEGETLEIRVLRGEDLGQGADMIKEIEMIILIGTRGICKFRRGSVHRRISILTYLDTEGRSLLEICHFQ